MQISNGEFAEENAKLGEKFSNERLTRILDPLDGTKDFIQAIGNYAMHLVLNFKNRPHLGVVLIPEKEELWFAYEDKVWVENREDQDLKLAHLKIKLFRK